jgi:hypothetical protein
MRTRTPALAGLMLVWAAAASAQSWQEAYNRQDYPTAVAQLQAIVFEHPQGVARYPDPQAIQTLAQMYGEGRGVARDPLTACALSNLGSGAAVYRHGDRDARTIAIQRQVEAYCVPLTAEERRSIVDADGCFQQGPAATVLLTSGTRRIEVRHSHLTVVERGRTREHGLRPLLRCAQQVPMVRYVRVPAPRGSKVGAREFVEIYSWHSASNDGQRVRTLEWSAIELTSQSAVLRARSVLEREVGSTWPARPVPDAFSRGATFSMHRSGDVRWQMTSRFHGVIGRPGTLQASTSSQTR